jgi:uncharacterized lipoprotein YddW (UPF0748 family)
MIAMILSRRSFLATAASFAIPPVNCGPTALKHWVWIPTNLRRTADEWKQRFALMRASGVRAILPEVYAGREAYFQSARLPLKTDWLGTILPLARAEDLEVHAWMWCMPCMIPDMVSKHPDWYNVNANGESASDKPAYVPYYKFMDPGRPEVREFVQETLKELASIPELTGVHLDYIRHPDAILPTGLWKKYNIVQDRVYPPYDYGYTDYERARFREKYGADPMKLKPGQLEKEWLQFRLDMVTGLVNDYLVPTAHAKRKMITAAVFPGPSLARTMVRQDWGKWKLDAFLPMLYNTFYEAGPEWVGRYTREGVASVKKPVYSGVFAGGMDDAALSNVMDAALSAGASGISIFSDGAMTETKWKALKSASVRRT